MNEKPISKVKLYLFLILIITLFSLGLYGYYKYTQFVKLQDSANNALLENETMKNEVEEYYQLKNNLEDEKNRCEQLLLKEEGNFAEFTYCQKYIDFLDSDPAN